RGHQRPGLRVRTHHPAEHAGHLQGAYGDHHRPPPERRARCQPYPGHGPRADRRAGQPCRTARPPGWPLLPSAPPATRRCRMSAKRELIDRYRSAWRHAWQRRRSMDAPPRLNHEVHFLPAALALQEAPVHPAPRIIQWTIMVFAALALLWACIGEIDVVATATG